MSGDIRPELADDDRIPLPDLREATRPDGLIVPRDSYYRPTRARKLRTEAARHGAWLRVLEWPVPPRPALACVLGTFLGMLLLGALAIPLLQGAGLLAAAVAVVSVSVWAGVRRRFWLAEIEAEVLEREHEIRYGSPES